MTSAADGTPRIAGAAPDAPRAAADSDTPPVTGPGNSTGPEPAAQRRWRRAHPAVSRALPRLIPRYRPVQRPDGAASEPLRFRRISQLIAALALFGVLISAGMVASAAVDDYRISRDRARAVAEVVSVSPTRTTVRFRDAVGNYYQPDVGLKYSVGLNAGQNVRVEFQASDPDNVKVEGRTWLLAWRPALSTLAVVVVLAVVASLAVEWRRRRWWASHSPATAPETSVT